MNHTDFVGQWWGACESDTTPGTSVMNVEIRDGIPVAKVYLYPTNQEIPATATEGFLIPDVLGGKAEIEVIPFATSFGKPLSGQDVEKYFPHAVHSVFAEIEFKSYGAQEIQANWETAVGTSGSVLFRKTVMQNVSIIPSEPSVSSWAEFRAELSDYEFGRFLFRGQKKPYPLQTSYHRTNRKVLEIYLNKDIPSLHRALSSKTKHFFDLNSPEQLGAFLNLAQHHGFPTPLLDWSYSPFVAAWFAYQEHKDSLPDLDEGVVRIFALDKILLEKLPQFQTLTLAPPHVSILEAHAIENNRATPQQGILTLTNIQNVEGHLQKLSLEIGAPIVKAFDLPVHEVELVMNELALMGITRSTLFPSVESMCLDARDKWFD